jgi:hypothetical protein
MSLVVNSIRHVALAATLSGALGLANLLAGCVGTGDDNSAAVPLLSDGGHASDAAGGDGQSEAGAEGGAADGGMSTEDATLHDGGDAGGPVATFSSTSVDFGTEYCATIAATKTLTVTNAGGQDLVISASSIGSAFNVGPTSLMLRPGMSGDLTVRVSIPQSSTAATPVTGSMTLFTNDPNNANRVFPLSATPTGATLVGTPAVAVFPSSPVGVAATPQAVKLTNTGNSTGVFVVTLPSKPPFTLSPAPASGGVSLAPGASWLSTASFTPTSAGTTTATYAITVMGTTCGSTSTSLLFNGSGDTGSVTNWPPLVDFGNTPCGSGTSPAPQSFTLMNTSLSAAAHLTSVSLSPPSSGFTTDATVGEGIPAGGQLTINVGAPPVPALSSLSPVTATLTILTDADPAPHAITLTEEPQGAVLTFDPSPTPNFGSFGTNLILLQSSSQTFNVVNRGNAPANVTLTATENDASSTDAGVDAGSTSPFVISLPTFTIPAPMGGGQSTVTAESLTFQPQHAGLTVGSLAMAVDSMTTLCGVLQQPLPLTGSAIGGGPVVTPTALSFGATCGGPPPSSQTFVLSNAGTLNLSWTMSGVTGPGASLYTVSSSVQPGLLIPGQSVTVTVNASAVPSPAPNPNPAELAAQITINTDVPLDPPHVVTLGEVPLGDQLSVSVGNLRFGQVPLNTTVSQSFTVTNAANAGSQDANFTLNPGASAYTVQSAGSIAAGGSASATVSFDPTTAGSQPTSLSFSTGDPLCTPMPSSITLSGTGTAGALALSATALAFGSDPNDTSGLVNCGGTGLPRTLTLTNVGNQQFNVTSLSLGKGSSSPFSLSGPGDSLPALLAIGAGTTLTITPAAIPATVADPTDPTAFSDTLTITTDVMGDMPHVVTLTMQPRGAVIVAGNPLQTAWTFGIVGAGSIGTFTNTIQNTGNASASVSLTGLSLSQVFGLQSNPTTVGPQSIAEVVGTFTPPIASGTWADQGQLVVATDTAFCQPLPQQWVTPTITLSGESNANAVISVSGNAVFATTDCGNGPPAGKAIMLTNVTNQALHYAIKLNAGVFYTLTDGNGGALAPNGTASIVVNPKAVTPGPGVLPGSAPYADDLLITVTGQTDAGAPTEDFTVPISWTLNGAVLSLTNGTGPSGQGYYVADSTSGFALSMDNTGTGSANVRFAITPTGAFSIQPAPPIQVIPNVRALPQLVSSSSSAACPSTTSSSVTPNATATFLYTGPVCQPFAQASVNVFACKGTF